jgi:hypothetical protein
MRWMTLWLLPGCAMGPVEETIIDELRVVSAIAEPPEVAPGESYTLDVTVADPVGDGFELLVWTCPPEEAPPGVELPPELLGGPCTVARPTVDADGHARLTSLATVPVPQWVLACAPGACDVDDATERQLRDPVDWLSGLPLEGVSAAFRLVRIAIPPAEAALENPVVEEVGPTDQLRDAGPKDPVTLRFVVPGAETAYGRATVGGFSRPSFDVADDGTVELEWYGPRERDPGAGTIYVVFEGEAGAAALVELPVE